MPRDVASPDINTEDFSAAVDFLSNYPQVDPEKIGIIGTLVPLKDSHGQNMANLIERIKNNPHENTQMQQKSHFLSNYLI